MNKTVLFKFFLLFLLVVQISSVLAWLVKVLAWKLFFFIAWVDAV